MRSCWTVRSVCMPINITPGLSFCGLRSDSHGVIKWSVYRLVLSSVLEIRVLYEFGCELNRQWFAGQAWVDLALLIYFRVFMCLTFAWWVHGVSTVVISR